MIEHLQCIALVNDWRTDIRGQRWAFLKFTVSILIMYITLLPHHHHNHHPGPIVASVDIPTTCLSPNSGRDKATDCCTPLLELATGLPVIGASCHTPEEVSYWGTDWVWEEAKKQNWTLIWHLLLFTLFYLAQVLLQYIDPIESTTSYVRSHMHVT